MFLLAYSSREGLICHGHSNVNSAESKIEQKLTCNSDSSNRFDLYMYIHIVSSTDEKVINGFQIIYYQQQSIFCIISISNNFILN